MPDVDKFERKLGPGWRKPYRLTLGGGAPKEVADACVKSLAKMLKEVGGCPGFEEIAERLEAFWHDSRQPNLFQRDEYQKLCAQFQRIQLQAGGHPMTKLAVQEAQALCLQNTITVRQSSDVKRLLAERLLFRMGDNQFLGRVRSGLAQERFGTFAELRQWEVEFKEALRTPVSRLAEDLARDPTAQQMRIPRLHRQRHSTAELLHQPIAVL